MSVLFDALSKAAAQRRGGADASSAGLAGESSSVSSSTFPLTRLRVPFFSSPAALWSAASVVLLCGIVLGVVGLLALQSAGPKDHETAAPVLAEASGESASGARRVSGAEEGRGIALSATALESESPPPPPALDAAMNALSAPAAPQSKTKPRVIVRQASSATPGPASGSREGADESAVLAALAARGDEAALAEIDRMIRARPRHAPLYAARGRVLAARQDMDAAQEAFARAGALDPKNADYTLARAIAHDQMGQAAEALRLYRALPAPLPKDVEARMNYLSLMSPMAP